MNAHADIFPQVPAIVKTLPDPIDQMKLFELIQIIPAPTRSALGSGNLLNYRISDPTIMRYLRNNSMFAFGQADRARTSATFREILDAMWLFNAKFEQALARFKEIKARKGLKSADAVLCCHEGREQKSLWGKPGLLSSGRKFARSALGAAPRIAAMVALVLLPIEASHAGWLSDIFKGSSKPRNRQSAPPRQSRPPRRSPPRRQSATRVKLAALSPAGLNLPS